MEMKRTILSIVLANCLFSGSAVFAAPLLSQDTLKSEQRIDKSNAWVEIDEVALTRNIDKMNSKLSSNTRLCAIIKADAYGHGVSMVMPALINKGVACLGFASNEEARIARASGYKGVLTRVRTASVAEIKDALQYDVEELVGNLDSAKVISELATANNHPIAIHIAINANGLSRNGLELATEQGQQDALAITKLANLNIVALMSHYPEEDREDVLRNLALFNTQSAWLIKAANLNRSKLTLHIANSFAALEVPESHLDMVRVGGAIYGDTVPEQNFERVMAFKTTVAAINHYPKGNTVGYDRTFTLQRDSRLANLPMGYSDGYRRVFSNKAFVLINGHRVPVVGKVSMNTTMVDVTDFPDIKLGDEVVLFGKQAGAEITQGELEEINGALLGDLYTIWGNSNPRVLKK